MTGFGAPRDVKGKHLKRIWELVRSRNLFVEKKQTTNICRSTPRRLKSHWTVFKQKRRSSDSAQIISRKFLTSQYHAKPILKTKTFHHQLDNFMLYQFLNSRFLIKHTHNSTITMLLKSHDIVANWNNIYMHVENKYEVLSSKFK